MIALAALVVSLGLALEGDSSTPPARVARGTIAAFEVSHPAGPLRAKALRDGGSPILVRVNALGGDRHLVECFAVVEGTFDLVPLLEQVDGRPPVELDPIPIEVFSQLPPNPGSDLYGIPEPRLSLAGGYRRWLVLITLAWLSVPIVAIVRSRMRRVQAPPPAPPLAPPTAIERIRAILDDAKRNPLDLAQRGRLELLLLAAMREAAGGRGDLAESISRLRRDPASAPLVLEVERWLHALGGESREAAAIAKVERLASPSTRRDGEAP